VKLENGELPPAAIALVQLVPSDKNPGPLPDPRVDSRGHFFAESLEPGTYELIVTVYLRGETTSYEVVRQQVTVGDSISEVTIVVKAKP